MSGQAPRQDGYYPQEAYYAPGWQAPHQPSPEEQDRRRRRTRQILLAGAAVLGVITLVAVVLGARYALAVRPLGEVDSPTTAHARQLDRGHCLPALPADGTVGEVDVVPCDEPHVAEVVGAHTLADGPWPGSAEAARSTAATCEMETAQRELGFEPVVWAPSEAAWGQGYRTGLCLAHLPEGEARGSWASGDVTLEEG
ncbi:septum formation family protein [Actinotalea sp. BY-33]|uniref:Septum formation family protein n=1 Tax=Actinotalea soli TaxID=2819234 RepID=A0A939LVW2_9CELL|nr:septum formation family protein [Actinotalea soli]MBO1753109.1 septum formation family protein [Actinotalea soli]